MNKPENHNASSEPECPKPVDVIDGIPDRSPRRARWKYAVMAAVFAAWVIFLIYVSQVGR